MAAYHYSGQRSARAFSSASTSRHALRVSIQLTSECPKPFLLRFALRRVIARVLLRGSCR
jgi:hypothetical protein